MQLMKLTLSNFKGVRSLEFKPAGRNAAVYGTNGSGKTTLFDALTWLLFDKASTGEPNFSPKTRGADGEEVHNLNHYVKGIFRLEDGAIVTFAKDQSENWAKKRGSASEELIGNKTEYFIDGVPVKKGEYESRIAEICPADKAQILTQPLYFPRLLDWKERRKLLLEVCGDITEYDVINSSSELGGITRYLLKPGTDGQFYSVEECAKIAAARGKDIRRRLEEIPARIDEATKALTDDGNVSSDALGAEIVQLQRELDAALVDRSSITVSDATADLRRQLADLKTQIAEGRTVFSKQKEEKLTPMRDELVRLSGLRQQTMLDLREQELKRDAFEREKASKEKQRARLVEEYKAREASVWVGQTTCSVCGQALPVERIEEAKAAFNVEKAQVLEQIRGQLERECSKAMIAELDGKIQAADANVWALQGDAKMLADQYDAAKAQLEQMQFGTYEDTAECAALCAEVNLIEKKLAVGKTDVDEIKAAAQTKIDALMNDIAERQRKVAVLRANEQRRDRIAELEAEEKKLQTEAEDTEYCLHLCEEFVKTKVAMLDEKINTKFRQVRFRLFETQINGSIKEGCEVMIPTDKGLIPFAAANNAAKINAGLEIIDTLSAFWGIRMPVFVDNAESVVTLGAIAPQVIRLIVSGEDKELRMEVEG